MHIFAPASPASADHTSELPFRRFDVVDAKLEVVLSGPSPERLAPAAGRTLEPALASEVRSLIHERLNQSEGVGVGLIGLDHGVRLIEGATGVAPGYYLICTERIALRGAFERLTRRLALDDDERELARLLAGGYGSSSIALRLGTTPHDVARRIERLLSKALVRNRREFVALVFPRDAERRSKRRPHVRLHDHDASAS